MRAEIEVRDKRDELSKVIDELKEELGCHRGVSEIRNSILAEIGEQVILIQWFDWVLGEREE